jgi:hypothetical protein
MLFCRKKIEARKAEEQHRKKVLSAFSEDRDKKKKPAIENTAVTDGVDRGEEDIDESMT